MEKQRIKSVAESGRRLLIKLVFSIILFCSQGALFSQSLTNAMVRELRITPAQGQLLYVNTEIKFEVNLPYTLPGQIDVSMPEEKENVSFKTLRKVESNGGTKIEIWFSFSKTGTYTLNPLVIKIKNSRRQILFAPVSIGINPREQVPLCYIVTSSGRNKNLTVQTGQKLKFQVCLQYATQLVKFSWDIPKDSIFVQGRVYEFAEIKQREKIVTDDLIPICDFEWTPLVAGAYDFPEFKITAVAYNGDRVDVRMPSIKVNVLKGRSRDTTSTRNYFSQAFEEDESLEQELETQKTISEEPMQIAVTLAKLRRAEKHSILLSKKHERMAYEKQFGLTYDQEEFSVVWIYVSAFLFVLFCAALIVLIKMKKNNLCIADGVLIVCALVFLIYSCVMADKKFGVAGECTVYSIPEESAGVKTNLPAGNRVQVISQSDGWYYIRTGETEGWCPCDSIVVIE